MSQSEKIAKCYHTELISKSLWDCLFLLVNVDSDTNHVLFITDPFLYKEGAVPKSRKEL